MFKIAFAYGCKGFFGALAAITLLRLITGNGPENGWAQFIVVPLIMSFIVSQFFFWRLMFVMVVAKKKNEKEKERMMRPTQPSQQPTQPRRNEVIRGEVIRHRDG